MNPIKCFLCVPTDHCQVSLRRYRDSDENDPAARCTGSMSYHNAEVLIEAAAPRSDWPVSTGPTDAQKMDVRWPIKCSCGYAFRDEDRWQYFIEHLFKRSDTGELITIRNPPVGAIWDCTWYPEKLKKPDGHYYCCRTPGGDWAIDGKCSNCTRPNEPHDCWVRHGVAPELHVGKDGNTCSAGAGSVITGGWHGFLHHGYLITA